MSSMKEKGVIKVRHNIHEEKEKDEGENANVQTKRGEKRKTGKRDYHTSFPERTF